MMRASKCNRCSVLFERALGDLIIVEVSKATTPPKGHDYGDWQVAIIDEDDPYDLCTACSGDLREFLKPITRGVARPGEKT